MARDPLPADCRTCNRHSYEDSLTDGLCDDCDYARVEPCDCAETPLSCWMLPAAPWEPKRKALAKCSVVVVEAVECREAS